MQESWSTLSACNGALPQCKQLRCRVPAECKMHQCTTKECNGPQWNIQHCASPLQACSGDTGRTCDHEQVLHASGDRFPAQWPSVQLATRPLVASRLRPSRQPPGKICPESAVLASPSSTSKLLFSDVADECGQSLSMEKYMVPQAALTAKESQHDRHSIEDWNPDVSLNEECFESSYDEHEIVMTGSKPILRRPADSRVRGDDYVRSCESESESSSSSCPVDDSSRSRARSPEVSQQHEAELVDPTAKAPIFCASIDLVRESTCQGFEYADDLLHSTASESGGLHGRATLGSLSSRTPPVIS
mmetsp:Transcript_1255/g.2172  ORF Transcript_1255/g.2172 Transcript_1255/m.2172 type:complete len:303 (-) Transcript_1255:32-940(-)